MKKRRAMMPGSASHMIPGWRLIRSDRGRFWAFRERAFPQEALLAGAKPDLDADTFDDLKAAAARQEEIAEQVISWPGSPAHPDGTAPARPHPRLSPSVAKASASIELPQ
ncbi:hypothetical protein [Streptosporangium oxazolinicum]